MKPKKAKPYWSSKFILKEELESTKKKAKKNLQDDLQSLRFKSRLHGRVRKLTFPCEVQYEISCRTITFYPPSGGWKDRKEYRKVLTTVVRSFEIRLERQFNEYSGTYSWAGTANKGTKNEFKVEIQYAMKPENCELVSYETKITKYKSVCGQQDNPTVA